MNKMYLYYFGSERLIEFLSSIASISAFLSTIALGVAFHVMP